MDHLPDGDREADLLPAWLSPRPAEEAESTDDANSSGNRPERAAGHRGALDQVESLAEPDNAGQEQQPSEDASRNCHVTVTPGLGGRISRRIVRVPHW